MGKNGDWALSTLQSQTSDPLCLSFPHYTKLLGGNGPQSPLLLPRGANILPRQSPGSGVLGAQGMGPTCDSAATAQRERGRYVGLQAAARGKKSNVSRESLRRPPARWRRRERRVLGGETGHGREGDNGGSSARRPRPPQPGTAKSAASSGRAPPHPSIAPPTPPHRVAGAVPFLGRDPCPVRTGPLHAPRLDDPPSAPALVPGVAAPSPRARPAHTSRAAPPGGSGGRDGTHLSGRSGGRGRPSLGGRGRAAARAPHLPLPAARAERARLGRERSGLGSTAPPPTAPSGGQSRHRGGAADSLVAP